MYRDRLFRAGMLMVLALCATGAQPTDQGPLAGQADPAPAAEMRREHIEAQLDWRSYYLGRVDGRPNGLGGPGTFGAAQAAGRARRMRQSGHTDGVYEHAE